MTAAAPTTELRRNVLAEMLDRRFDPEVRDRGIRQEGFYSVERLNNDYDPIVLRVTRIPGTEDRAMPTYGRKRHRKPFEASHEDMERAYQVVCEPYWDGAWAWVIPVLCECPDYQARRRSSNQACKHCASVLIWQLDMIYKIGEEPEPERYLGYL